MPTAAWSWSRPHYESVISAMNTRAAGLNRHAGNNSAGDNKKAMKNSENSL